MPKDQHPSEDKSSPPLNQNDSNPDQRNQQNTVHPQHSPAETTEAQPTIEANTAPALISRISSIRLPPFRVFLLPAYFTMSAAPLSTLRA